MKWKELGHQCPGRSWTFGDCAKSGKLLNLSELQFLVFITRIIISVIKIVVSI